MHSALDPCWKVKREGGGGGESHWRSDQGFHTNFTLVTLTTAKGQGGAYLDYPVREELASAASLGLLGQPNQFPQCRIHINSTLIGARHELTSVRPTLA
jgi:hypothetical protein